TVYLVVHSREQKNLQQRVAEVMDEVQGQMSRVQREQRAFTTRSEYRSAKDSFHTAQDHYNAGRYPKAMAAAQRSRDLLQPLLNDLSPSGGAGLAQFISTQGDVEYRRSGASEWQEARSHIPLHPGDSIRTADGGSAEIIFADGTLYTVRPNTQLLVSA